MQYLVTNRARVWAHVNGRISPDFPIAFIEKGTKVDGDKISEYITSEQGSLDEPFISLNNGKFILARNVKAIGKEFSSATGDTKKPSSKAIGFGFAFGLTGGIISVGIIHFIYEQRRKDIHSLASVGLIAAGVVGGTLFGNYLGHKLDELKQESNSTDTKQNFVDEINNNGVTPAMKLCNGGYWQGSLASGHCVYPKHLLSF